MATLTPPFVLIDALGTKNITPERNEQFAQLMAHAQEVAPEACEVLLELKEVLLRLEPGYAEQWMADMTEDLTKFDVSTGEERKRKIHLFLCEMFVKVLIEQIAPVLDELKVLVDLSGGKPQGDDDPVLQRVLAQKISFKWHPIIEFYAKARVLTPKTQNALTFTISVLKQLNEMTRRNQHQIQNAAAAKARRLQARAKRKKR